MKRKILLGLFWLSMIAFAKVDLSKPEEANSNVFNGYQTGMIKVKGSIISYMTRILPIKYVVAGTLDDGVTLNDTVELSDFIISNEDEKTSGFVGGNEKVKVMKLVGGKVYPLEDEKVTFRVINTTIPNLELNTKEIKEGISVEVMGHQLLSKVELDKIASDVTEMNPTGKRETYLINSKGELVRGEYIYVPKGKIVGITQERKGELKFFNKENTQLPKKIIYTRSEHVAIESILAKSIGINGATVVKVNISL